jgi:hypothetical protein
LIYIVSQKNPDIRIKEYVDMNDKEKIKNRLSKFKSLSKMSNIKTMKGKKVDIY